jgi:hypothetical protein
VVGPFYMEYRQWLDMEYEQWCRDRPRTVVRDTDSGGMGSTNGFRDANG